MTSLMSGQDVSDLFKAMDTRKLKREPTMQERKIFAESGRWPADVEPPQMSQSEDLLPMAAGALGAVVGGVPGAALGGMAGEAARQLTAKWRGTSSAPQSAGQSALGIVGEGALQGLTEGTGRAIAWAAGKAAPVLMRSALKPSVEAAMDVNAKGVPKVVQTMLDEGVTVTPGGVKKLYDVLQHTGANIENKITQAGKYLPGGGQVFPEQTVDRTLELTKGFADQFTADADLRVIADKANQFLKERIAKQAGQSARPASPITVRTAQNLKTGTYDALGKKAFNELKGAEIEAEKAGAISLKEQIEALVPSVKGENAKYGAAADALDAVARRVGVTGNRDLGGIFWVANNPTAFLAAQFDRSPAVKSLLARGLYEQAGKVAQVPPALLRLAMAAIATQPDPMAPVASHEVRR